MFLWKGWDNAAQMQVSLFARVVSLINMIDAKCHQHNGFCPFVRLNGDIEYVFSVRARLHSYKHGSKWGMVRAIVLLSFLTLFVGCGKPPLTEQEYAAQFKAASEKYFAVSKEIADAELPDKTNLTSEERVKILAEHVRRQNAKIRVLADEYRPIVPPEKFKALHQAYLDLLEGQVKRDNEYAAAIATDDRAKSDQLSKEFYAFLKAQLKTVIDEIEKAGGDVGKLRENFKSMMEESISA